MNLSVKYQDAAGVISTRNFTISRLAFVKHLAIAGQGYAPKPQNLLRTLGMLLHYSSYLQREAFNNNRFSEPPVGLSDPTEKAQFSNLAGKALADFLSKKIDNSLYTVTYEAAMRLRGYRLVGQRPDLIAYTSTKMFALEAKGRHQPNPGSMIVHKNQAGAGPINVNFSIACVSYNIYNQIECNYYDPINENVPYDNLTLSALTRNYYSGFAEFLRVNLFDYREFQFQGEDFYEVALFPNRFDAFFKDFPINDLFYYEMFRHYRPRLILPKAIFDYSERGITNEVRPFIMETKDEGNIYIDNDRVGLRIR